MPDPTGLKVVAASLRDLERELELSLPRCPWVDGAFNERCACESCSARKSFRTTLKRIEALIGRDLVKEYRGS